MGSERLQLEARDTREMNAVVTQKRQIMMECRGRNDQVEVRDSLTGLAQTNGLSPKRHGHFVRERRTFTSRRKSRSP